MTILASFESALPLFLNNSFESFALGLILGYFSDRQEIKRVMNEKAMPDSNEDLSLPASLNLKAAVQKARIEDAERSDIAADLRAAEVSRLEILANYLGPVFSQLPPDADMFDHGFVAGKRPRLYIDMVAFIEMSRDRRTYRFLLDTRSGRQLLGENDDAGIMAEAITNYLGRRIVERDKALASDLKFENARGDREIEHSSPNIQTPITALSTPSRRTGGSVIITFILGLLIGAVAMVLYLILQSHGDLPWQNPLEWFNKASSL